MSAREFGLPPSTYPKAYFRRGKCPNIFRDDQKHKRDGVVFANEDYFHKDAPKSAARDYVELSGGLTHHLSLPWNFPEITYEDGLTACEEDDPVFKPDYPVKDVRCHIRFMAGRRQAYVPFLEPMITVPSAVGNQMVNSYRCFTRPDHYFIKDTQKGLMMLFNNRKSCEDQLSSMTINPGLVNLKLLTPEVKDATIRHIGKTIRNQQGLEKFSYENGFLSRTDATRILIAAALGAGHTLEKVFLPNLFSPTLLPIETESEYLDVFNEFEYVPEKIHEYSEETKTKIWKRLLECNNFDDLPLSAVDNFFVLSLRSFSNLTVLMVNYTWLSKGNGLYLLNLESIRNGKLRKLILLLTPIEQPARSKQVICHKAWSEAVKLCPDLELHLILGMVTFEVWHPECQVDTTIASLILHCPMLKAFVFKGNIDKMETIHAIYKFLIETRALRLRRLEFYVIDDPCRPVGWDQAIQTIKDEYQTPLALKGITLALGIWKV